MGEYKRIRGLRKTETPKFAYRLSFRKSYVMLAEPASSAASESFRVKLELRITKYAACVLARIQDLRKISGITIGRPQSLPTYLVILVIF